MKRNIPGCSVLGDRKRRHSGESKKVENDLRKTIETLQEIISCQQHLIVQKYKPFATQEGFFCRVPSCEKPFSRSDTLKRHFCTTDDPTHKSLATVMDQTHCIECHDTRAAPRNLTRHDRGSHNTSVLRLDRILGGELWTCRDISNSPTPVSDSSEHNPDNYTFQSSVQDMALPKVMSNNGASDGNSLRLETSPNTHYPYSVADTQPLNMETGAFSLSDPVPLDLDSFWTTMGSGQPFSEQIPLGCESQLGSTNQNNKDRALQLPSELEDLFSTAHQSSILNPPAPDLNAEPFPFTSGPVPLDFNSVWGHGNSSRTDTASLSSSSLSSSLSVPLHDSTLLSPNTCQTNVTPQPPSPSNSFSSESGDTPRLHLFSRPKVTNLSETSEAELKNNALQVPVSLPLKFLQNAKSKSDKEHATIDVTFKITCV